VVERPRICAALEDMKASWLSVLLIYSSIVNPTFILSILCIRIYLFAYIPIINRTKMKFKGCMSLGIGAG
jgi:hypothetical protein